MIDKKQVIYDMERCICNVPQACMDCSHYTEVGCMESLMSEALDLLEEQETKQTPKDIKSYYSLAGGPHGACPSCYTTIPRIIGRETRYCPFCGQAVKWDDG